jgi:hypothetical protein
VTVGTVSAVLAKEHPILPSGIGGVADNGTSTTALVPEVDLIRSLVEAGKFFLHVLEFLFDPGVPFGLGRVVAAIAVIATGGSLAKSSQCKGCIRDLNR